MRLVVRILGVMVGLLFLWVAVYYAQLGSATVWRTILTCASYTMLGLMFLIYGIRGKLRIRR